MKNITHSAVQALLNPTSFCVSEVHKMNIPFCQFYVQDENDNTFYVRSIVKFFNDYLVTFYDMERQKFDQFEVLQLCHVPQFNN